MDVKEMETNDFDILETVKVSLRDVWKKKLFVVLFTIIGVLLAVIYVGLTGKNTYYISKASIFSAAYGDTSDSSSGVSAMNTNTELIGSSRVCDRAASMLTEYDISSDYLKALVNSGRVIISGAGTKTSTYGYTLYITTYEVKPEYVVAITNAMASAYANEVNDLIGTSAVQVMDEATSYGVYDSVNIMFYLLIGAVGGAFLSAGIIFMKRFVSPWAASVEQCEKDKDKVLGMIPFSK